MINDPAHTRFVRRDATVGAFLSKERGGSLLPTFATPERVLVPLESLRLPSDDLIRVVEVPGGHIFGITGTARFKAIAPDALKNWAHQSLAQSQRETD